MKVREAMSQDVISVHTDTPFRTIVQLLGSSGVSGVPVTDEAGHVIGMVSGADLVVKGHRAHRVKVHSPIVCADEVGEHTRRADGVVAGELMTTPAVTVDAEADLRVAARLMTLHGIRRLPVTTDRKIVGILTRGDVLNVFLRPDAEIEREVREEILGHKVLEGTPDVTVEVVDGVVYLRGVVHQRSTARVIGFHADRLDGVTKVVNEVRYEVDDLEPISLAPPPIGPLEQVL